ncbi:MAG: NAD-dependent epimerase/dehydratase family protein, partial [Flavobacteriia bacterium]|nr:NAD-dependent epimerase/dehydratase family protein [Flavobacteriia bacterium]
MMHTFLITGGTGMVGQALTRLLEQQGHVVRHLSTRTSPAPNRFHWDPSRGTLDPQALQGVTHIIHLAGANVAERWTAQHKAAILDSRVKGSATLEAAIAQLPADQRPEALISASAVGIYPNHPDYLYTEHDGEPQGFLGEVVHQWEAS